MLLIENWRLTKEGKMAVKLHSFIHSFSFKYFLGVIVLFVFVYLPSQLFPIQDIHHARLSYVTGVFNKDYSWQALRSFAACSLGKQNDYFCSCYMISPTVVQTAAHCIERGVGHRHADRIIFRSYHNQDYTNYTDEVFNCPQIPFYSLQASDSDIMLLECEPNIEGVLPGDKYGFIDTYNASSVAVGTSVESFWSNPVVNDFQDFQTILYSWGQITSNASGAWPTVSCETGIDTSSLMSDLYCNPGASGSVWIYEGLGFRTLTGPTSTGDIENYRRDTALLSNVLWGDGNDFPWVEEYIDQDDPNPGLCNQSLRVHQMDENNDGVFDAVMEVDSNLAPRDIYSLNIDTRHRRLMWRIIAGPHWFNWIWQDYPWFVSGSAKPTSGTTGWHCFLERRLPLEMNQKYHVRVEYKRENTSKNSLWLRVAVYCPHFHSSRSKYYYYPYDPIEPKTLTFEINTTSCTSPRLKFSYYNDSGIVIHRVTVQKSGAMWNFDNYDTREDWRKDNDEGHALITPDGYLTGFAAIPYGVPTKEWNENCMNRAIPLLPNKSYTLYFRSKRKAYYGNPSYVLVRSKTAFSKGENNVIYREFTPPSNYWMFYGYTFTTNNYHDYYLSFGQKYQGEYYIDNVYLATF